MLIREITQADRREIATVFRRCFAAPPWNEHWSEESALAVLDEWLPAPQFFGLVALNEGAIVGAAFGRFETWDRKRLFYVKELCVVPEYQRNGIGTELNRALEEQLRSRKVEMLYLLTRRDSPAAAFYASQKFERSERTAVYSKKLE